MSRVIFSNDENKLHLKAGDLFDRIINLKIVCEDVVTKELETFVIRSDYELVYTNVNLDNFTNQVAKDKRRYFVRRCSYKPSIKVQCNIVTTNTATKVDIFINNFFVLTKNGDYLRSFNSSQYHIKSVLIAMGYWGQFENTLNPDSPDVLEQYFDIKAENGADSLMVTAPIVVTTDKLPPDSTLHINGKVADVYGSPVGITKIKTATEAFTKPSVSSGTSLEKVFYETITRRYINPHAYMKEDKIGILNFRRLVPVSNDSDVDFIKRLVLDPSTNQMSIEDANQYGVKVFLSKKVMDLNIKKVIDSNGEEKDRKIYFESGWTIGQTIVRIMSFIDAELEFTFTLDGDVLIYTPKEMIDDIQSISDEYEKKGLYKNSVLADKNLYDNALPAVYNINIDTVSTIVCPFFTFIQPFQYVEFVSRYALTSTVAYYASYKPTIYRFRVIKASISFATEEAVNEVQLTAVSARESVVGVQNESI